jgi:NDP-4-keto-2,6-dideoxyhexose 3-C-methyltransferase
MVSHLHRSVGRILEEMPPERGSLVIDVGANDSTTLQAFPKDMYTLVGIDPTASKFKSFYPEHIRLISDFFSKAIVERHLGSRKAGLITSFSMFYDLEEPLTFMREVADVLDDNGIWMFEQSYMPTMLRNNSYDTVCHEHLEYYALKQITWMANRVGLKLLDIEFNDTNGGSVAVIAAKKSSERIECPQLAKYLEAEAQDGLDTVRPYLAFTDRVQKTKEVLRKFLDSARSAGKSVVALGASTKGNVLLQYCGVTAADVSCVGDVNPDKFGSFTPGTLLPIVSEDEALAMRADYYLVLPWHFRPFFLQSPKFAGRNLLFPLPEFEVVSPG